MTFLWHKLLIRRDILRGLNRAFEKCRIIIENVFLQILKYNKLRLIQLKHKSNRDIEEGWIHHRN